MRRRALIGFIAMVALAGVGWLVHRGLVRPAAEPKLGEPRTGLSVAALEAFYAGRELLARTFDETAGSGPTTYYNETNCLACHAFPAVGVGGANATHRARFWCTRDRGR